MQNQDHLGTTTNETSYLRAGRQTELPMERRATGKGMHPVAPVLLYVVNVAWFFRMHRLHLAEAAKRVGFEVHVATAPDASVDVQEIRDAGLIYHEIELPRRMSTPADEARVIMSLFRLHRKLRPAIVHNVTIKPVIWGTLAARAAGTPAVVNSICGLGTLFVLSGIRAAITKMIITATYRVLFRGSAVHAIFENPDDLSWFLKKRLISSERTALIRGAGVNLKKFRDKGLRSGVPVVVLPARMVWIKGVAEFCAAARLLQQRGIVARFVLVGRTDPDNPSAVPTDWLMEQQRSGCVEWWGHRDDMSTVYSSADVVCLPSYVEGLPTVLIEGAACGCALVASEVAGSREVVQHEKTGLLVPVRDAEALARALSTIVRDADMRRRLAGAALRKVQEEFSIETVQRDTLRLYDHLLNVRRTWNDGSSQAHG
jgi:glycosyltransferase involved in cell wall biosynthesis